MSSVSGLSWVEKQIICTEEVVEQFTAVLVGMESVINVGLEPRVDMTVVKFAVEDQENWVYNGTVSETGGKGNGLAHHR